MPWSGGGRSSQVRRENKHGEAVKGRELGWDQLESSVTAWKTSSRQTSWSRSLQNPMDGPAVKPEPFTSPGP